MKTDAKSKTEEETPVKNNDQETPVETPVEPKYKGLEIDELETSDYKGRSLHDAYGSAKKGRTYEMGLSPLLVIPSGSIGMDATLMCPGIPVNRIMLGIGEPDNGKTTFSHELGSIFDRNGGDVILCETENALEETYAGRFYDMEGTLEENFKDILQYQIKIIEKRLKSSDSGISAIESRKLEKRKELTKKLLDIGTDALEDSLFAQVALQAEASWRMRRVVKQPIPEDLEELEAQVKDMLEKKKNADPTYSRPSLLIVDSLSQMEPKEGMDVESSSDGKKMGVASFMHRFSRRWATKLSQANIAVLFLGKETCYIEKPFEFATQLKKTNTVAGDAIKYISNHVFKLNTTFEKEKDNPDKAYKNGSVKVLRSKTRGHKPMPKELKGNFRIYAQRNNTKMDFDTPFFEGVFKGNLFGITCNASWVEIPKEYIPAEFAEFIGKKVQTNQAMEILKKSNKWRVKVYTDLGIAHHLV
jgi:KaiC/GvpD/RAD55 family RecA-like ATPase